MSWLVAHIDRERGEPGRRDGEPLLVADSRIDNRDELRDSLGIRPRDDISDSALLARGFAHFGASLPSRIASAFAFVVWDPRSRTLFAARDPMGETPLYYRYEGSRFWFASTVEQLLATSESLPPLDDETVFGFLGGEFARISSTFFRGIHRLPPGHFLLAKDCEEPQIQRYWHPPEAFLRLPRTEDYHARFRNLLAEAVRVRLRSEGPVLAHLSGGLDSSSIACLANRILRESPGICPSLRLVSGLYPGLDCDESHFIRAVTEHLALPWEGFDATAFAWTDLERPFLDGPGGRSSQAGSSGDLAIAQRQGARVLLSGFGGDDVGSEAGIFRDLAAQGRWKALLGETLLVRDFHWGSRSRALLDGLKGLVPQPIHEGYRRYRQSQASMPPPTWLGPRLREIWPGPQPEEDEPTRPFLSHTQRWLWRAFTHPNRAWCVDIEGRQAAEAGVTVRYPFLDVRLADFVLSIPPEHRLPGGSYRVVQRKAMAGLVPETILRRHEATTFEAAFLARARANLSTFRAFFDEGEWLSAPYLDRAALRKLARDLEGTSDPHRHFASFRALENAALLEAWLRRLRSRAW